MKEELAAYAHEAWGHWMKYLFSKTFLDHEGNAVIPKEFVDRWFRQMHTSYQELPESEKESDRNQADKILEILED